MRRRLLATTLVALVATALVWQWDHDGTGARLASPRADGANSAASDSATTPTPAPPTEPRIPAATDAGNGQPLRVRLDGLHALAPWTAPLRLTLHGESAGQPRLEHDAAATPDAHGLAAFALPDWYSTVPVTWISLAAEDPHYQEVDRNWGSAPDLTQELVLDVQVVAAVTGRVVDEHGVPIREALVRAFAMRDGAAVDQMLGRTRTNTDGTFRIGVPPETPVFLVAAPTGASSRSLPPAANDSQENDFSVDDLLPTSCSARASIGEAQRLDDLVLARGTILVGTVRWQGGEALAAASVRARAHNGTHLWLDGNHCVQPQPDGRLGFEAGAGFQDDGSFRLLTLPGVLVDVEVTGTADAHVVSTFTQSVVPPQRADFTLPRPVRLRAMDGRKPVPHADVEVEGWQRVLADEHGEVGLVTTRSLRVRAGHEQLCTPWIVVPPSAAGTTVDLAMVAGRVPLAIEFTGDVRFEAADIVWRGASGDEGRRRVQRDDGSGLLQVFLAPDCYHLTAVPGGRVGVVGYVLPVERDVDLSNGPQTLILPVAIGGSFRLAVTDSRGVFVGGRCQLRDSRGADVLATFDAFHFGRGPRREVMPGELSADGVNDFLRLLSPGEYELTCEFVGHGTRRRRIVITPLDITEVRIRLP